jgi:hypothetical protein
MVGALTVACGDDDEGTTGPTIADLVGTWNATTVNLTWNANPTTEIDLVQGLGLTVQIVVNADGTYTFSASQGAVVVQSITGDFNITGSNSFTLTNDDEPGETFSGTFSLTNSDNTLTVNMPVVSIFDFDQDGEDDDSEMDATFSRVTS